VDKKSKIEIVEFFSKTLAKISKFFSFLPAP